jgi:hypothetical protein
VGSHPTLLVASLLSVLASSGHAQGGYLTEKFPALGLELPIARHYASVPVQPTEQWIVLKYALIRERVASRLRPSFFVLRIDRKRGIDAGADEVFDLASFLAARFPGWRPGPPKGGKERDGFQAREFELAYEPEEGSGLLANLIDGWAYAWESPERVLALVGFSSLDNDEDRAKQRKIWRYTAEKMQFEEPRDSDFDNYRRLYARRGLIDPEYRIQVRKRLSSGWKVEDTDHYIIAYSTRDKPLIRLIERELEAVRKAYEQRFPPAAPIEAVSTVRVCNDSDEYRLYGGPRGSGGYWNSETQELVFFDYVDAPRKVGSGKANSRIVLYHEAFHQYIHYSTGELPPHPWFNEGYGDYFSGAVISSNKVIRIGVNPWRVAAIQEATREGEALPWGTIVSLDQKAFYAKADVCYPQAWSMVYFLLESEEAQDHKVWPGILPTYFDVLKTEYALELMTAEGELDEESRRAAGERVRARAVEAAFYGVDWDEIDAAWREFTLSLRAPR